MYTLEEIYYIASTINLETVLLIIIVSIKATHILQLLFVFLV